MKPCCTCVSQHLLFRLKIQRVRKSYRRGGVCEGSRGDTSFLALGKTVVARKQRGLNQSFVLAGGNCSSANTRPGILRGRFALCVCTTSLCWRQPRLLPVSLQPRIFLYGTANAPTPLIQHSSNNEVTMNHFSSFHLYTNLSASCGVEQNSSYRTRAKEMCAAGIV